MLCFRMENLSFFSSMVQIFLSNVYKRHFVNNDVNSLLSTYASFVIIANLFSL